MDKVLREINDVIGVAGSFVCNATGDVIASDMPQVFPSAALPRVGRILTQTIAGLGTARRKKVVDIDLQYLDRRLVVKNLREGCLCIVCACTMNVPLLNLTADVGVRKINRLLAGMDEAKLRKARLATIDKMRGIAEDALGANAAKATALFDAAAESDEDLAETCAKVEEITRLFIDSRKAKDLASKMQSVLEP